MVFGGWSRAAIMAEVRAQRWRLSSLCAMLLVLAHSESSQTQDPEADAAAGLFGAIYILSPVQEGGVFADRRRVMLDRLSFLSHKLPVHIMGVCALVRAAMLSVSKQHHRSVDIVLTQQVHHSQHELLRRELNLSATSSDNRKMKPAWGRLANLAGNMRIHPLCLYTGK